MTSIWAVPLIVVLCPEIDPEVDFDSRRAVYFRQMRYGLFVGLELFSELVMGSNQLPVFPF